MDTAAIRRAYLDYHRLHGHAVIARASLVPREDPTTLFTGSGMQPLLPYLLGAPHPAGDRLVDSQTCLRAEDIDEVGDTRHTTFFEMLGNWSLGAYFKAEQIERLFTFLVDHLRLDPSRLYATAFAGAPRWRIPRDDESASLWVRLFATKGIVTPPVEAGDAERAAATGIGDAHVLFYDESQCWWSRSGPPSTMPEGEPGGPDSEVFYEFPQVPHDPSFGAHCHPHCDCGRFIEIGNSVFMQYLRTSDGFVELPRRNVDFGAGLERLAMAVTDTADMFQTDLLRPLVDAVTDWSGSRHGARRAEPDWSITRMPGVPGEHDTLTAARVIADHARAVVFLAADGVVPSNTAQGYVMRRFARRAIRQGLSLGIESDLLAGLVPVVVDAYCGAYPELATAGPEIQTTLGQEEALFRRTLSRGVREFGRLTATGGLTGDAVFTLFDTFGFPPELSVEEAGRTGVGVDGAWRERFTARMAEQKQRSKTASAGLFKGGLADHSEATTRLHTATHLLYKALRLVLGEHVVQRGSNITPERLRFDFSHPAKLTRGELDEVERIVNEQIDRDWPMVRRELPTATAFGEGALGAFGDRYGETVQVYTAGDPDGEWYSNEICGGPHVAHTGVLGRFQVVKEESSSSGVRRIRAVLR
ncbi:alanine--tRNA ligase [Rugosimonospora africana]|uniref:alanine--tRNA ligase n=1 Tax=Rugosimonospora africana TaxID=556532 RepID=UPI0019450BD3|nr:alanine--tRNA ligase [Rugosimonospora africana]